MTGTPETVRYPLPAPTLLGVAPEVAKLRGAPGLARVRLPYGEEAWLVTRHAEARFVLGDQRFSRVANGQDTPRTTPVDVLSESILGMDPPHHTRLRKLVARAFTMRRIEALRDGTRRIARGLVADMIAAGPPADLAASLAAPLPITVICTLLGVPLADRDRFRTWSDAFLSTASEDPEHARSGERAMLGYLTEVVARRRKEPAGDLISAMLTVGDADERLSDDEVLLLIMGLLVGGHETTTSQLPNFVYVLLAEPDRYAALCADPALIPRAVEELMRYVPLIHAGAVARFATEDVRVGGTLVRAGDSVVVDLVAANRDGSVFTAPEDLDLAREDNPHIGFGHGVHHCLGAPLARMELQVGLEALVTRLPGLRLAAPPEEPALRRSMMRAVETLPVTW